jgi:hypothetical protein
MDRFLGMYKGWAIKTSPCTVTFNDLLCSGFLVTKNPHSLGVRGLVRNRGDILIYSFGIESI